MGKVKVYDPKKENMKDEAKEKLNCITEIVLDLVIYAFVLVIASKIFKGFYIENFTYAFFAASILSVLNATVKPALCFFTMPITIVTLGVFYPIINIILIKLCSLFLAPHFYVEGILAPFFMVIFISAFKMILDNLLLEKVKVK